MIRNKIIMDIKSEILNVSENGSIFILLGIDTIITDTYTFNCPIGIDCTKDKVTFTGSSISVKAEPNIGETKLAECIDYNVINGNPSFHYDACFGTQSNLDSCIVNSPFNTACREADPICFSSGTNLGFHIIPAPSSKLDRAKGKYCWNDAGTLRSKNTPEVEYRICQSRQFHCISDTQYQDKCSINAAPDYVFATYNCPSGSLCDSSIDDEKADFGSKGLKLPNAPCSSVCNGNIQVTAEDRNGNPMTNLLVSRDGVFSMQTNEVGVAEFSLTKTCGSQMEFIVNCQDGVNVCGIKTTKFDVVNTYKSLLFDCSVCSSEKDLQIDGGDINVFESDKLVTAIVSLAGSLNAKDINITFRAQGKNGLISKEASQLFDLNSGDKFKVIYQNISLTDDDEGRHCMG